jgi:photosystem II stability/assembly factor-like uncharacterized protein
VPEASPLINGPVFAVAFAKDGRSVVCVTPAGVFRFQDGTWSRSEAPDNAAPARAIVVGAVPGRFYLLGRSRMFRSDDGGRSFQPARGQASMTVLAAGLLPREILYAVIDGRIMTSENGGESWEPRSAGLGAEPVDVVAPDPAAPGRVWAAQANRIHVSDDAGFGWRAVGQPLPPETTIRGIAADPAGTSLTVATHRGLYRSEDGGRNWAPREGSLPFHLEAGPLVRVPNDLSALYAVFSRTPYPDVWRAAVDDSETVSRSGSITVKGGLTFALTLLTIGTALSTRLALARRAARRHSSATLASPLPPRVPSC